jgi:hypothetical protein
VEAIVQGHPVKGLKVKRGYFLKLNDMKDLNWKKKRLSPKVNPYLQPIFLIQVFNIDLGEISATATGNRFKHALRTVFC